MLFFTSDLHLGHKNVIRYCNRPFTSVEEMDNTIITNWNNIISSTDEVYVLGDICFGDKLNFYMNQLNGTKTLICGNHDRNRGQYKKYFKDVKDLLTIKHEGNYVVLCHYAMRVWEKSHFNSWHCYGHSHGTLESWGKSYDVGVDNNNFTPVSFEQLKTIMNNLPNNFNWIEKLKGFDSEEFSKVKEDYDNGIEVE